VNRSNRWIVILGSVFGAVLAGCLDNVASPPTVSSVHVSDPTGWWVLVIGGPQFGSHVQVVQVRAGSDSVWPLRVDPVPSLDWQGLPTDDLLGATGIGRFERGVVSWVIQFPDSQVASAQYQIVGDSAFGAVTYQMSGVVSPSYPLWGVRGDSAVLLGGQLPWPSRVRALDSIPRVLLRVDDVPTTDLDFLPRLSTRGLVAELAVPSGFVGRPNRLTWEQIRYWTRRGFGIAAHSRTHGGASLGGVDFAAEVIGSLQDLASHGLATRVFVQPGTWVDSSYVNTTGKLHNWRGALLKTCSRVFEAYAHYPSQREPVPDSMAFGLGHFTISDGINGDTILSYWQRATRPHSVTVFMVHSSRLKSPDGLDWFLDSLADATAGGRVRLVPSSDSLFGH